MFPLAKLLQMSVHDFFVEVINHNVIQQSLKIGEEKRRDLIWFSEVGIPGLGDVAPLTQTYQYHFPFDNFRVYRNTSKLNNTLTILSNIEYATDKNGFWQLTPEGT